MQAMLLEQPGPVEESPLLLHDLPAPEPAAGEILLEVRACGVCRTDLHIVEGELPAPRLPLVPGHQVVGRVAARGPGADRFRAGERAGVAWLNQTCGACRFCASGRENLCPRAHFTGYTRDGGYARFMVVHQDFAYRLPEGLSEAGTTPLLCAGIIGFRSLQLSGASSGDALGLFGFGQSAHLTLQVARHRGSRVFVFTRGRAHRELALELGAEWAGGADEPAPAPLQAAILFAPVGELVPAALEHLDRGGVLVLAGIYSTPIPELQYAQLYQERVVRTAANATRRDGEAFLRLAAEIPVQTRVEEFALEEANRALLALKESRINGAAALVLE